MMKMNFHFTPAAVAELSKLLQERPIVLFCRIKVRVIESLPFCVPKFRKIARILLAPLLQPFLLNISGSVSRQKSRYAGRLEVVRNDNHDMHWPLSVAPNQPLPCVARQAFGCIR